ncbi:MAG: polysaccharide deacetylase family protein [Acidobacteria bacterium]|nr:MAG: polysaccharide deacetylase family protein [Acidobacteriota bacterium]
MPASPPLKAALQLDSYACENGGVNPFLISVPAAVLATGGVAAYGAAFPRAQPFGPTICRTNSPRKLAITFDDGPNPAITPKLLDLLDRYQAKATFFLIGRFVRECPGLVKETAARGHALGNHTESHRNLFKLSPSQITVELRLCHHAITNTIGAPPKWFRPPYGFRNPWVIPAATALGCKTVMWTLIPGDWLDRPVEWLIRRMQPIASHAQRNINGSDQPPARGTGDVLCLHDGYHRELNYDRTRTLASLEHWLPRWRNQGLEFVTIDQAVGTPAP